MTTKSRQRYGSDSKSRTTGNITSKVLVVICLALVALGVWGLARLVLADDPAAEISLVNQEYPDDDTLRVWVDITRDDPSIPAYCIVQAFNYDKAEVGRAEIPLPPGEEQVKRYSIDVPVRAGEQAVAGGVYGCSDVVPAYLDVSGSPGESQ